MNVRFVLAGADLKGGATDALSVLLDALTRLNIETMRKRAAAGNPVPPLYSAGLRYQREDYQGIHPEDWRDCLAVLKKGGGDCEDLAAYRAAELCVAGYPSRCVFKENQRPFGRLFHIVVQLPNGTLDDPSRRLGMGRE